MPSLPAESIERARVAIEDVRPEVDAGRFAAKRSLGDTVVVEATVFADGHDELACQLLYRRESENTWHETPMRLLENDRWRGEFVVDEMTVYAYKLEAWIDVFGSWRRDLKLRHDAEQDLSQELVAGSKLIREAASLAGGNDVAWLTQRADALGKEWPESVRVEVGCDEALFEMMRRYAPREPKTVHDVGQRITVDRERARYSTWYELFPRSTSRDPAAPGNLRTTMDWLPYIAGMGFDVLYLPPIHPIGETHRKGRNNNAIAAPHAVGSPWAIGSKDGGHDAIDPGLGTMADFKALVAAAAAQGIEIALDLALQCSPDHPWVTRHPAWFKHRPDGSIRYAENPPKKYEDIYPLDFETEDWQALWQEIDRVVRFWVARGVQIFRVDNPHTKPLAFWEWLIAGVKHDHPAVLFLAEAFTRPAMMYRLAKAGFSQSYTYFTWRNNLFELGEYMRELTRSEVREYFRPNFWPNTPDILHEVLQHGGRPAFVMRLLLAATLSSNYGIYGPSFELGVSVPREAGAEEYLDSEKYEVKHWDIDAPHSLRELITRVNHARRDNPALQRNDGFRLLEVNNDALIAYAKVSADGTNRIVCVVNMDPYNLQSGWVRLPREELGLRSGEPYELLDLIDGARYTWHGEWNYVELNPHVLPGHLLRLEWPERSAHEDGA